MKGGIAVAASSGAFGMWDRSGGVVRPAPALRVVRGAVAVRGRGAELDRAMRAHPAGRDRARGLGAGRGALPQPRLRLTARGRLLAVVLALALLVGLVALAGGLLRSGGEGGLHLVGESRVVVHSGDTLWSIARSVAGDDDVRAVVARIREVNGLQTTDIVPGQVLRLP